MVSVYECVVGEESMRIAIVRDEVHGSSLDRSLERWIGEWRGDDEDDRDERSARVELTYAAWLEAGRAPAPGGDAEQVDLFESRHSAMAALASREAQHVAVETVGHVGAPDLSFQLLVDGARVADADPPIPFARDGAGKRRALVPCAFAAFVEICRFNARGTTTRAEQLVFVSELRAILEGAAAALAGAPIPFTFELDPHLAAFREAPLGKVALGWKANASGKVFDLEVTHAPPGEAPRPLDLKKIDREHGIVELSSTEHVVLPPDVEAVARVAKTQRSKLRKDVERYLANPSTVIPEGISVEHIDLSGYSARVVGFAPITAERALDIQSSGVAWYETDDEAAGPFLRLFIAQPGGGPIETVELATPAAAEAAADALEASLGSVIDLGGKRVHATQPLADRIRDDLAEYRARATDAVPLAARAAPKGSGRLAAVIADDAVAAPAAGDARHPVPWDALAPLLAPGIALKEHQRAAVAWLWTHYRRGEHGVLLADDMGLGKTFQLSAFLALQRAAEPDRARLPNLIVCPVILLENWRAELRRFFRPEVFASLVVLYGDELKRRRRGSSLDASGLAGADTVLTNYETLQTYQQSMLLLDWNVVVLDEAQQIKNAETYRARAARGLKRRFGICSTGTPVENRLGDLWSLYDFLRPGDPFSTQDAFRDDFESGDDGIAKVRSALRFPGPDSSLLRRTKQEVLDLPPKTIEVHPVPMTPHQVELERHVARDAKKRGVLASLQDLQKLYQHPQLLVPDADWSIATALDESPKLRRCVDLLREIRARGEKALVFTLWTRMQDMLVAVFEAELGLRDVRVINGDPKQRGRAQKYIDELGATDGFGVLVLSPLAAGTGLTITAANHVIHYGRWWNPAKEDQATDRAYRIGQTRPVQVHYPVLHHPGRADEGFDVKLHGLVEKKRSMARDFLAPHDDDAIELADLEVG